MSSSELLQFVVAGLKNGSIYALVALGFTIVYAATRVINFAQGEFFMLGGMFAVFALTGLGLPLPLAIVLGVVGTAGAGLAFDMLAIRPRKDADPLALIIITIGGSMLIKSFARHRFGPNELPLPPFTTGSSVEVFGATIELQTLWIWALTLVAVLGLSFLYSKTKLGRAMRACMENREAARLMGIDTQRVVMISFGLAAALGALAGVVVAPLTQTSWDVGTFVGVKGFAAAILGGLGNPFAAVAGGIVLGLVESLSIGFLSSTYKDVVALVVLLSVLFVRPQGLFRRSGKEKV
ncbi:MAG: branched-chain amino acid ABC transporter permease [Actinobacteria bacterium]|nr:MAG: branched-chain amino acid ABC transporter permease [Actinomycetota bacterium]